MISSEVGFLECLSPLEPRLADFFGCFYTEAGGRIAEVGLVLEFVQKNLMDELNSRVNKFIKVGPLPT